MSVFKLTQHGNITNFNYKKIAEQTKR